MPTTNLNFGGGVADSAVNPLVLAVVLIAGILICVLPRTKALVPFLAVGIMIPTNQVLVLGGAHFPMVRLLAVFGLLRVFRDRIFGNEKTFTGGMNGIDWAILIMMVFTLIDGALLWQSQAEVVYQLGNMIMVFGVYFLARHLIRSWEDVRQALKVLACVCVIVAGVMMYEHFAGVNVVYKYLGGNDSTLLAGVADRGGGYRAKGPFAHSNLAGPFGGFMMPLFVAWWWKEKAAKKWAGLGAVAAMIIPFMTGSSTALFALLGAIGALCLWPIRKRLRLVRWAIVGVLVTGQLYMTAPVWHIISDVSLSADSSSYHRYMLVDQCIRHFWTWAMVGTTTYASWGWDMWDLSNQYVLTADQSGLIPLLALLAIIVYGFKYIGRMRKQVEGNRSEELFIWAIGASLFANFVAFWGIGYFDQIIVPWYALLAIISTVTLAARTPQPVTEAVAAAGAATTFRPALGAATASVRPAMQTSSTRGTRRETRIEHRGGWRHR